LSSDIVIEEDDEKFTLVISRCGTGGRIQKEVWARKTTKPYPWSFNQAGVNYYCSHCLINSNLYKEHGCDRIEVQWNKQVSEDGSAISNTCKYIVYKNS
jgi:hypothetical protein